MFDISFLIFPKVFFVKYFEMWERDVKLAASRRAALGTFFFLLLFKVRAIGVIPSTEDDCS
jgi:hypothetical protein